MTRKPIEERNLTLMVGDAVAVMESLPTDFVHTMVTSPPYWRKRDYEVEGQIGLEETPQEYVQSIVRVMRSVRDRLRPDGTAWLNVGDTYASSPPGNKEGSVSHASTLHGVQGNTKFREGLAKRHGKKLNTVTGGLKPKDMGLIPQRLAIALQEDGWWVRSEIIWHKPNGTPESVRDRPTQAHEQIWLLSKTDRYYYGFDDIAEPAPSRATKWKNRRDVWSIYPDTAPKGSHVAVFPEYLAELCVLGGAPRGGIVLDPFVGSGTTGIVARRNQRKFIGIDLDPLNIKQSLKRIKNRG